jgi:hypothetical protein
MPNVKLGHYTLSIRIEELKGLLQIYDLALCLPVPSVLTMFDFN